MFRQAKRRVVIVRLHTLSSWLPNKNTVCARIILLFLSDVIVHIVYKADTELYFCYFNRKFKMRLVILDDYSKASEWAAKYVRNRILEFNPDADRYFTLGLPTGK